MKKILIAFAIIALSLTSCNLDEQPQATADKEIIFGSEAGLEAYAYSFYAVFPSAGNSSNPSTMDAMCDYGCVNGINKFIRDGGYNSSTETNWSWGRLRNINYFIDNCINPKVSQTIRDNYIGIARFFRAYFYYDKLTTYGEVPWIDHTLTVDAEELYASRDSRDVIINHIIEDLDFAYTHITTTKNDGSMITKWVPAAFKSRVCLFEGTYRKYHTELNLASSANALLEKAVLAAKEVMEKSGHGINTAGTTPYRDLFKSDNPITKEVMLAVCCSKDLSVLGAQNWWWNSSTFGIRFSPIKAYVNTYLMLDGTPFTNQKEYQTMTFTEECQSRDKRFAQSFRTPGYTMLNGKGESVRTSPNMGGYTYTGYQSIKYVLDDEYYDTRNYNTNAMPLMRFAEVLLNYAEAKAELGSMTDEDWATTIGTLRSRAGITGGLETKPTTVDSYLQRVYFPEISDPVLLEVRRERSIELSLEGFRFDDLRRWKRGELMAMDWTGMYVPSLNTPMDLDNDGTDDVVFYKGAKPTGYKCDLVNVDGPQLILTEGTKGNLHYVEDTRKWYTDGRQYLYPIPHNVLVKNPNLKPQNPGWTE